MLYTAVVDGVPYDLGEHASQQDAEEYAYRIFGGFELVTPQLVSSVDVSTPMPTSSIAKAVLLGALVLFVFKGRL